jgi:tetratricopeptide (TPR) repeat protein
VAKLTIKKLETLNQRLPVFGTSVILYGTGLLISWLVAGGELVRVLHLAAAITVFWLLWFTGKGRSGYRRLYYLGFILVIGLAIMAITALPLLDDDYLRSNRWSQLVTDLVRPFVPRMEWLVMHRNALAGIIAVFGTLAAAYMYLGRRLWGKTLAGGATVLFLVALFVTNSRGGLAALLAGFALLGVLVWNSSGRGMKIFLLVAALTGITATLVYLLASGQWQLFQPDRLFGQSGAGGRMEVWSNSLYMLSDVPVTGVGPGQFQKVYPFYLDPLAGYSVNSQEHAHNLFLQTYVELGFIGFAGMVLGTLFWVRVCWEIIRGSTSWRNLELSVEGERKAPLIGGLAAFGALLAYGVAEHSSWNGVLIVLLWVPLGLAASAGYRSVGATKKVIKIHKKVSLKKANRTVLITAALAAVIVGGFVLRVGSGLVEVNTASLEKLQYWKSGDTALLEKADKKYGEAAQIISWVSAPSRGQAWAAIQKNEMSLAEKYLLTTLKIDPSDHASMLILGDVLDRQGRTGEAIGYWRQANAAPQYLWRGRKFLDSPDDTKAEPFLKRAIEIDPKLWDGYAFLVMLYQRHGRTADSIALLQKAITNLPGDPRPLNELEKLEKFSTVPVSIDFSNV